MDCPRRAHHTDNSVPGAWLVQGQLPVRIIFVLEKNPSKADLPLKCAEGVLLLENSEGVNSVPLPVPNVMCGSAKGLGAFRNTSQEVENGVACMTFLEPAYDDHGLAIGQTPQK